MKSTIIVLILLGCSCMSLAQTQKERDWSSFVQTVDVSSLKKDTKFKLSASVKVELNGNNGSAALWVRVDDKYGRDLFFYNMYDNPIKLNEWKTYSIEGAIDEGADKINFGGLFFLNGKFYFDNFELLVENERGEFQKIPIKNSGFETELQEGKVPGWVQGTRESAPVDIKGFSFSLTDQKMHGSHSLLIEGKDVK